MNKLKKFSRGQGLVEYVVLVALLAVAAIATMQFLGGTIRQQFAGIAQELAGGDGTSSVSTAQSDADKAAAEAKKSHTLSTYGGNSGK